MHMQQSGAKTLVKNYDNDVYFFFFIILCQFLYDNRSASINLSSDGRETIILEFNLNSLKN